MKQTRPYCVYKFTNKINGKVYIGITRDINKRIREHKSKSKIKNYYFCNAIKEYGLENFDLSILYECENRGDAYTAEAHYISFYKSNDIIFGYNMNSGGGGLHKVSDETRKKISQNHADISGENNPMFGKQHSEETRNLISQANKGKLAGENNPMFGKTHTFETRLKISENKTGKPSLSSTKFKPGQIPKSAKLTMEQVREIRIKYNNGSSYKELQEEYRSTYGQIWRVVTNRSFKDA